MEFLLKIKINKKQFIDLLQSKKEDNDIIYNIGRRILTLLFDFEKDDFEDKNNNSDDERLKNENEDKNSQNEGSDTDENPSDSKNEIDKENINDIIISFKNNIDEILKNYGNNISKSNINYNDINSKMSFSKKSISINNIKSIFERLYGDEELNFKGNFGKTKIQYPKKSWKENNFKY